MDVIDKYFIKSASALSYIGSGAVTGATLGLVKGIMSAENKSNSKNIGGDTLDDGNVEVSNPILNASNLISAAKGGLVGAGLGAAAGYALPELAARYKQLKLVNNINSRLPVDKITRIMRSPAVNNDTKIMLGEGVTSMKNIPKKVYNKAKELTPSFTGPIDVLTDVFEKDPVKDEAYNKIIAEGSTKLNDLLNKVTIP